MTETPSKLISIREGEIECRCGCNRSYPLFSGLLAYGTDSQVAFRLAHFAEDGTPNKLWLLLGSGPWYPEDPRGCWCILSNWVDDGTLIARAMDASDSPFFLAHIFDERFLTRAEVLKQEGALNWAVARREDLIRLHQRTREFILGKSN